MDHFGRESPRGPGSFIIFTKHQGKSTVLTTIFDILLNFSFTVYEKNYKRFGQRYLKIKMYAFMWVVVS